MRNHRYEQRLDELVEIRRHRPLTADETARLNGWFEREPELRERWEEELALTRVLGRLPDAPVPSNFNAVVWSAVERSGMPVGRRRGWVGWWIWRWPAWGYGVCILALWLGWFGYGRYESFQRARMAASVADISRGVKVTAMVAELPAVEIFRDFEAIYRLSQVSSLADEELLAILE